MIPDPPFPAILLYNPLSGHGHLDSWLALFARILLERGLPVQVLTPGGEDFAARMARQGLDGHPLLTQLPWPEQPAGRSRIKRILSTARSVAEGYAQHSPASRITPDMPLSRRLKKRLLQWMVPPVYGLISPLLPAVDPCATLPPRSPEDAASGLLDPAEAGWRIAAAMAHAPSPPAVILHMYMDMYSLAPDRWQAYAQRCPRPWTGVRFVPATAERESYYALDCQRGMCFLDEQQRNAHAAALPGKDFALLPDITDATLPEADPPLVQTLRQRAGGRRIVFLGGSIGGQKNLARFEGLLRRADPARWFFVLVGEIHRHSLDAVELAALERLTTAPPEQVLVHAAYLEDERGFNAVIAASAVIFAVYKRFAISSNMPGKAAWLERPILAARGYLMGDRVERYGIGRVVPEDDEVAMLEALEDLAAHPVPADNFAAYRAEFSEQRLGEILEQHLRRCMVSN